MLAQHNKSQPYSMRLGLVLSPIAIWVKFLFVYINTFS